ncbi:hypothetical protein C0J52_15125 [Blattella germanica]|nr:hypothetical protein C0J52_15125 [Blattella germanica]
MSLIKRNLNTEEMTIIMEIRRKIEEYSDSDPFDSLLSSPDTKKTRSNFTLYNSTSSDEEIDEYPSFMKKRRMNCHSNRRRRSTMISDKSSPFTFASSDEKLRSRKSSREICHITGEPNSCEVGNSTTMIHKESNGSERMQQQLQKTKYFPRKLKEKLPTKSTHTAKLFSTSRRECLRNSIEHLEQDQTENTQNETENIIFDRTENDILNIEKLISDEDLNFPKSHNGTPNHSERKETYSPILQSRTTNVGLRKHQRKIGLKNPSGANKCWLNAALQTTLAMESLNRDIINFTRSFQLPLQGGKYAEIATKYIDIINAKKRSNAEQLHSSVHQFHKSLEILSKQFTSSQQQDAAEFMAKFFDALEEEFSRLRNSDDEHLNPISDNLTFKLEELNSCRKCSRASASVSSNKILNISIDEDGNNELQKMIEATMMPQNREYDCELCDSKQIETTTRFISFPKFLVLQLERFRFVSNRIEKIRSNIIIPNLLTLSNSTNTTLAEHLPNEFPLNTKSYLHHFNYKLIGMVTHLGEFTSCGHYTADVYSAKNRTWIHYDDENVGERHESDMRCSKDGYIFVYVYEPLF